VSHETFETSNTNEGCDGGVVGGGGALPSLQVVAVLGGAIPEWQFQGCEALLVEDECQAATLVVHLVLLCRIQAVATLDRKTSGKHTHTHTHMSFENCTKVLKETPRSNCSHKI